MKVKKTIVVFVLMLALTSLLAACTTKNTAAGSSITQEPAPASSESIATRRLKMTLNRTDLAYAELVDSPATAEFLGRLPFRIEMHEHLDRQKEVYLPFSLSEESRQNTVYEYEVGDIVYWHPGPTMGIFTEHDGRRINSGIEVLARMDDKGIVAFQTYDGDVEVLFELETDVSSSVAAVRGKRQLTITLNDTDVIYAALLDTPAANAFVKQLPLTLNMTDYANREKHAHLNFRIDDTDLRNIQYPYEIGDIIYYPPGPTFAMYYAHDGREISAGMEVIARLDEAGIERLGSYANAVKVTVKLSD
jgi:hypothetical protein